MVEKYYVTIAGWPDEVPFKNLSDVSNLPKLELLLRGWNDGSIRFRPLLESDVAAESARWTARISQLDSASASDAS